MREPRWPSFQLVNTRFLSGFSDIENQKPVFIQVEPLYAVPRNINHDPFLIRPLTTMIFGSWHLQSIAKGLRKATFAPMEKQAVVTGSTRGIGKAVAEMLAASGYGLWLSARKEAELTELQKNIVASNDVSVHISSVDFAQRSQSISYGELLSSQMERVDVLVNNVGIFIPDELTSNTQNLEPHMAVNFHAPYEITQHLLPKFIAQGRGHIFNICSVVSRSPREDAATYTIAKSALYAYTQVLQKTLRKHGVKVTAIFPGSVYTSSWDGVDIDGKQLIQPSDIAETIRTALALSPSALPTEIDVVPLNPRF